MDKPITTTFAGRVRVLLIGLGNQGMEHLEIVRNHPGFSVVGLVDSRASELRDRFSLPVFEDITEVSPGLYDAAIVATPPLVYERLCPFLIGHKKHILVEKPFGCEVHQALEWTRMAGENRVVVQPAVQRRFHSSYCVWDEYRDRIGSVKEAFFTMAITHKPKDWRADSARAGGGVLFDLGFHAIDLSLRWFGPMSLVYAAFNDSEGRVIYGVSDERAELLYLTETGVAVRLSICRGSPVKSETVQVRGDQGSLFFDRSSCRFCSVADNKKTEVLHEGSSGWEDAMKQQLDVFFLNIEEAGKGVLHRNLSPWDGIHAMKMMKEAYARVING